MAEHTVVVPAGGVELAGDLSLPEDPSGLVLFAHGSGSSRHSPRNRQVAAGLQEAGLATLLVDLLTLEEERVDVRTRALRFDIDLLAVRLVGAAEWLAADVRTEQLPLGVFGASTGAAAGLVTAARRPHLVRAVVSRGGRPDLAEAHLAAVQAPVLLIVGGADAAVFELNRRAARQLTEHELTVVPGASHLFEEPGALEQVTTLAATWFSRWLRR